MEKRFDSSRTAAIEEGLMPRAISGDLATIAIRAAVPIREPVTILTERQKQLLTYLAKGMRSSEIASLNGFSRESVQLGIREIKHSFVVKTATQVVAAAIEQGQLDLPSLVPPDFDASVFERFTSGQSRAFSALIANNDAVSDGEIAFSLGIEPRTFTGHIDKSLEDLGSRNRTQATVLFLEARRRKQEQAEAQGNDPRSADVFKPLDSKLERGILSSREKQVLTSVAKGHINVQVADEISITEQTVKYYMSSILRRFGAPDRTVAVRMAIELGEVDLQSVIPEGFDPAVMGELSLRERDVVLKIIEGLTNKQIAYQLKISEHTVKNYMSHILKKTGALDRTQVEVFYMEARRRKQEEAISRGEDPGLVDPFYWGGSEEGLEESKAERPLLSQKEQEVLSLVGSGLTNGEVAGVLHITLQTVKNRMFAIIQKLNISDRMQGVVKGIETGLIDLSSLVLPDFDPAILDTLSPKERELVTLLARSYGGSTNKELAYELGVIEQTIKNHISSILRKTGARDRTQIAVFFLEAKRRKQEEAITRGEDPESVEVFGPFIETVRKFREKTALSPKEIELLVEVGAGLTNEEIARKYGISEQTIRNRMRSIALKFGTSDRAQLVVRGIEQGLIDLPSLVPPDFKPSVIEQLSNTEREVLAFMVRNNGGTTNREIAQEFGVSEYIVKKYMDSILKRTGAKNRTQAAVFYLEAERREEKRKALLPEEKEALSLAGQGFTNEEAAIQMGIPVTTIVNIHTAIRSKLGVSNVASAIVKAAEQGQIDLS
ncbi:MAG: LuxR C-terminal-related transcriptional regulator, partial [Patescibacteria group bacterium]